MAVSTRHAVILTLAMAVCACGKELTTTAEAFPVPDWAKVAPEQIAEAKKHGVPVAFENDIGMRFVLIPAGTFVMGSPEDEEGRGEYEMQHEVTVSQPYYMSIHEVTNDQYRKLHRDHESGVLEDDGLEASLDSSDQPVVDVSFDQATAFTLWVSKMDEGREYAIPTEAQWEYACRAGTTTRYSFGSEDGDLAKYANISDVNDPAKRTHPELDDSYAATAPVGSFRPNPWGLYDMHGNAAEWCELDPTLLPEGHVPKHWGRQSAYRGGAWDSEAGSWRSAYRYIESPTVRKWGIGFRLVSPLPEPSEK